MASAVTNRISFGRNAWLIAYDIADPRRLACVHRLVKRHGIPLQYSLFIAWLDRREVALLADALRGMMDFRYDDVRLYALPTVGEVSTLGQQWLPAGIDLYENGVRLFGTVGDKARTRGSVALFGGEPGINFDDG